MSLLQIVLLVIIIPITILNIRFITTGRRTKQVAQMKYRAVVANLQSHEKELGGEGNYTAAKYVSDAGDNYLVCRSKNADLGAVVTESDFFLFNPLSDARCGVAVEKEGEKKIRSVVCRISSPAWGDEIVIPLARNPHGVKGVGSFILRTAEDFKDEVNRR